MTTTGALVDASAADATAAQASTSEASTVQASTAEASGMTRRATRCALRPVVVSASLEALHGPVEGLVELPQRLFWSGAERVFDLSDSDRLLEMYEVVFEAARAEADLAEYINGGMLARVWPQLALAPRARRAWEAQHPGLLPVTAAA